MATIEMIRLNLAEASRLCNLTGVCADLESAKHTAHRLIAHYQEKQIDPDHIEVLSIAILVKYSRALGYGGGMRGKIDVTYLLTPEEHTRHKSYIDMRSKHIAHSVNVYEENAFYIRYNRELSDKQRIVDVSVQHARVISISAEDANQIIRLIDKLLHHCEEEIAKERSRLVVVVRNMNFEEILSESANSQFSSKMKDASKQRMKE